MASKVVSRHRTSTETHAVGEWRNGKMTIIVPVSEAELDWLDDYHRACIRGRTRLAGRKEVFGGEGTRGYCRHQARD
jgi:hypothetical protein